MTARGRAYLALALVVAPEVAIVAFAVLTHGAGGAAIGLGGLGLVFWGVALWLAIPVLGDASAPRAARISAILAVGLVGVTMVMPAIWIPIVVVLGL